MDRAQIENQIAAMNVFGIDLGAPVKRAFSANKGKRDDRLSGVCAVGTLLM
jgi:hypothetical protein